MPEFLPGQTIETKDPIVEVFASPQKPLPPGKHVFELVVVDDADNESLPARVEVTVLDTVRPTAVVNGPERVPFGQAFKLDGSKSTDIGGRVVAWRWTRIG